MKDHLIHSPGAGYWAGDRKQVSILSLIQAKSMKMFKNCFTHTVEMGELGYSHVSLSVDSQ